MAKCEVCGNDYDKSFTITISGRTHTFDSFECAIHAVAPICRHCGCRIVGHGVEQNDRLFCCSHCARQELDESMADRMASDPLTTLLDV